MNELKVDFNEFEFDSFVKDILSFGEENFNSQYAIAWVKGPGDSAEYGPENEERDYLSELTKENKMLFFTFSISDIGEPIPCANGSQYKIDYNDGFSLGDTSSLGYLFRYSDGELIINSAVNFSGACMSPPSVNIEKKCGVFDAPMEKFVRKYVKK